MEAVQLVQTSKKPLAQIARDLGIADSMLHHWCQLFSQQGEQAFPGSGHQTPQEEEIRQGKREHDLLRQERDSLKKARGIFSRRQLGNCNSWPSRASSTRSPCCAKRWRFPRAALMPGKAGRLPTTVEKMPSSQAKSSRFCLPHRQVSGSPPIHAVLKARGRPCSRKPVLRLMHQLGLSAGAKRSRKPTTKSDPRARFAPNHLNRELTAEQPTSKWVSDTKAVEPAEGWLYLAVILDLFSRMLGGWAGSHRRWRLG